MCDVSPLVVATYLQELERQAAKRRRASRRNPAQGLAPILRRAVEALWRRRPVSAAVSPR